MGTQPTLGQQLVVEHENTTDTVECSKLADLQPTTGAALSKTLLQFKRQERRHGNHYVYNVLQLHSLALAIIGLGDVCKP